MAIPFFLTGANAKIKIDGKTMAFVTDVAYTVIVKHSKPHVLGMYEPQSIDPVSYNVSGSFTVIRYASGVRDNFAQHGRVEPPSVGEDGNGIGAVRSDISSAPDNAKRVADHLDPRSLHAGLFFDVEIFQKVEGTTGDGDEEKKNTIPFAKLRKCRITRSDFRLSKKSLATQTFSFEATYADEDSFLAGTSGDGQHLGVI